VGITHHGMEIHLLEGYLACTNISGVNTVCVSQS